METNSSPALAPFLAPQTCEQPLLAFWGARKARGAPLIPKPAANTTAKTTAEQEKPWAALPTWDTLREAHGWFLAEGRASHGRKPGSSQPGALSPFHILKIVSTALPHVRFPANAWLQHKTILQTSSFHLRETIPVSLAFYKTLLRARFSFSTSSSPSSKMHGYEQSEMAAMCSGHNKVPSWRVFWHHPHHRWAQSAWQPMLLFPEHGHHSTSNSYSPHLPHAGQEPYKAAQVWLHFFFSLTAHLDSNYKPNSGSCSRISELLLGHRELRSCLNCSAENWASTGECPGATEPACVVSFHIK